MLTTYVIGDTHFNHKNLLKFAAEVSGNLHGLHGVDHKSL